MLNELSKEIHENALKHGWWDEERTFGDIVALCHSELSESLEEFRNNKPMEYFVINDSTFPQYESQFRDETDMTKWKGQKTEGKAVEMADCIIRILDWCAKENIDIDSILMRKMEYNKTRPFKHGGKVI